MQNWLGGIDPLLLLGIPSPRSRIVPWPVGKLDLAHVTSTIHVGPYIVHKDGIEDRDVGVEVTLLEAVDQDTRSGRRHLDSVVGDSLLLLVEGKEDFTCSLCVARVATNSNLAEERATRVCEADQQEDKRRSNRGVDAVLDRGEDGDQDGCEPDEKLERGDAPVGVDLVRGGD